ncbi:MAG: TetR/AcrR family transcriptional regulator [Candidatus Methylacidiphilales bacterium]|nr:TetR/AcrR family transcriptional regulator [Candidatus Methylacidiphilales bacterium]
MKRLFRMVQPELHAHDPGHAEAIRERIMDAGEKAFAEWGFAAASLRQITSEAGVNLAAVNYYFGSKDVLYTSILSRVVQPLNQARIALLEKALLRAAGKPLALETILDAFCRPCFEFSRQKEKQHLLVLLGKSLYESDAFMIRLMEHEWKPVVVHFERELKRTLPELPSAELTWRFHFAIGAMIHTISQARALEYLSNGECNMTDGEEVLRRLVAFGAAGMRHSPDKH